VKNQTDVARLKMRFQGALKYAVYLIGMYADDLSLDHRQNAPDADEKNEIFNKCAKTIKSLELNDKIHKRRRQ